MPNRSVWNVLMGEAPLSGISSMLASPGVNKAPSGQDIKIIVFWIGSCQAQAIRFELGKKSISFSRKVSTLRSLTFAKQGLVNMD